VAALLMVMPVVAPAQQVVWFTPLPYGNHPVGQFGSTDYMSLFSPTAPWQQAASHVQVFKVYGDAFSAMSDTDATTLLNDLNRRNISLAMEWPVLSSSTWEPASKGSAAASCPSHNGLNGSGAR
jgi:hypothetical protein